MINIHFWPEPEMTGINCPLISSNRLPRTFLNVKSVNTSRFRYSLKNDFSPQCTVLSSGFSDKVFQLHHDAMSSQHNSRLWIQQFAASQVFEVENSSSHSPHFAFQSCPLAGVKLARLSWPTFRVSPLFSLPFRAKREARDYWNAVWSSVRPSLRPSVPL